MNMSAIRFGEFISDFPPSTVATHLRAASRIIEEGRNKALSNQNLTDVLRLQQRSLEAITDKYPRLLDITI